MSISLLRGQRIFVALFRTRPLSPLTFLRTSHHTGSDSPPIPPDILHLRTHEDTDQARSWIQQFKSYNIPKSLVDMTFSRSSGPGGQNVNKVNTKATLRCPVDSPWIPAWSRWALTGTRFYAESSKSILITSTVHRSQSQNIDECLSKLHALISEAASDSIKTVPTKAQVKRAAALSRAANARRKIENKHLSNLKESRRSRSRSTPDW